MTPRRPHMPLGVKLAACLIHMGYHPADAAKAAGIRLPPAPEGALAWSAAAMDERARARIDFDHSPALALRPTNNRHPSSAVWIPGANDPRFIQPLGKELHGPKSIADTKAAAKVKRIQKRLEHAGKAREAPRSSTGGLATPGGKLMSPPGKRKRAWPKGRKIATRAK